MDANSADTGPNPISASGVREDGAGETWPMGVPVASGTLEPVSRGERFITLDVLRGVAVLGILLVNIFSFCRPFRHAFDYAWVSEAPFDSLARILVCFFATEKFITLFCMLFGMGLILQWERARSRHRSFVGMYSRRLVALMVLGLLHGTLAWFGDILFTYAILGFVALLFRGWRARNILAATLFFLLLPLLLQIGMLLYAPERLERTPNSEEQEARVIEEECADCDVEGNPPALVYFGDDPREKWEWEFHRWCFMCDEERVYQSGTWLEAMTHRTFTFQRINLNWSYAVYEFRYLATFLLGMALMKWRLFRDREEHRPVYTAMVLYGLIVGGTLSVAGTLVAALGNQTAAGTTAYVLFRYVGSLGMSFVYAGVLALLCLRVPWRKWLRPLAAVGQMGLSNYLGQSIICGLIFYGYGLGLFNRLGAVLALLIAFGIFACQLIISPLWLRYFRFGPFEWLWRTLTYLKIQPMRRKPEPVAAVQATVVENSDDRLTG